MREKNTLVRLPTWSALCLLLLLLTEPPASLWISLLSSALHELGHLLAMRLRRVPVRRILIYPFGPIIEPAPHITCYLDDMVIYSAGIVCNLLAALLLILTASLLSLARHPLLQHAVLTNLALALLNALPHPALDGGGVLSSLLLRRLSPITVRHLLRILGDLTVIAMSSVVLYGLFYGLGSISSLFFFLYLLSKLLSERDGE